MEREFQLKKISFLTSETQDDSQLQPVSFKDNIISNALQYIKTQYPWLTEIPEIKVVDAKPKEATAQLICVIKLHDSGIEIEFPLMYSDGEFLPIAGFFIPDSNMWVPFNEKFYKKIKENLSDKVTIGTTIDSKGAYPSENNAFFRQVTNNPLLATTTSYYKMSSLTSILSSVPKRYLGSFLKTATLEFPDLIIPLYSSYKIADMRIRAKEYIENNKKNNSNKIASLVVNPVFTKISSIIDLPDTYFSNKKEITREDLIKKINENGFVSINNNGTIYEEIDKDSFFIVDSPCEVMHDVKLIKKIRNIPNGKSLIVEDVPSGKKVVFFSPKNLFNASYLSNESEPPVLYRTEERLGVYEGSIASYNQFYETNPQMADRIIYSDKTNLLVRIYSYTEKMNFLDKIFKDKLTITHILKLLKKVVPNFRLNTSLQFDFPSVPFYYKNSIYKYLFPNLYGRKTFSIINLNNGYSKLLIEYTPFSQDSFSKSDQSIVAMEIYFDNNTSEIVKIKYNTENILLLTKESPIKVFDIKTLSDDDFIFYICKNSSYYEILKIKVDGEEIILSSDFSIDFIKSTFTDYSNIIEKAVYSNNTITVFLKSSETEDKEKIYGLIYKNPMDNKGKTISLDKLSKIDLAITLGFLGFGDKDINNIIKKAEVTSDYTFGLKPNPAYIQQKEEQLQEKEQQIVSEQLEMLLNFIKQKFEDIEKGIASREELLQKQLELHENKLKNLDEIKEKLNDLSTKLENTNDNQQDNKAIEQSQVQPSENIQQQPTIDIQTATMLAQALIDPNMAKQYGITEEVLQLLTSAFNGDINALNQLGLNELDLNMISNAGSSLTSQNGYSQQQSEGQQQYQNTQQNQVQNAQQPEGMQQQFDVEETAKNLVMSVIDPNFAQQNGVTQDQINYIINVINNPEQAKASGEDPALVDAVVNAYNMLSGQNNFQNANQVSSQYPAEQMPVTQNMQPTIDIMNNSGLNEEANVTKSVSALLDIIPKIKSSKVFFKYIPDFKKMLSILGEILFSLQYQSLKYKTMMGQDTYNSTIDSIKNLYEDFGDFILKMFSIENA